MNPVKTRVALLGNMNNNFFNLTRYLRDLNFDAHLFIFPSDSRHFQPEADSYDLTHQSYVHHLSWGNPFDISRTPIERISKDLENFSFFIGCGTAPAYLAKAGIQLDLMIPYGADLYDLPFFKIVRPTKIWHYYIFTRWQKRGIQHAKNLSIADTAEVFEKSLSKLKFSGNRLFSGIPMVYIKQYSTNEISKAYSLSAYFEMFNKIRRQFDFIIFHNSRHCWKTEPDPVSLKDNDKLFKGLALFLQKFPTEKVGIITFEYGRDVSASKELVKELKLENNVFWFPLMARKELMIGMSLADIVAGEFRNSWFTYGVVFEAMTLSKPIMHFRDDKLYPDVELYPMIYARESTDIAEALARYTKNKNALAQIGAGGRAWFMTNIVNKALADIQKILTKT